MKRIDAIDALIKYTESVVEREGNVELRSFLRATFSRLPDAELFDMASTAQGLMEMKTTEVNS